VVCGVIVPAGQVLAVLVRRPCSDDQISVDEATLQAGVVPETRRAVYARTCPCHHRRSGFKPDQAGVVELPASTTQAGTSKLHGYKDRSAESGAPISSFAAERETTRD